MRLTAFQNIHFVASTTETAQAALAEVENRYGQATADEADVIVSLGGDGFMLQTLHRFMNQPLPVYGMNRGSIGFLMNEYSIEALPERIEQAKLETIYPLTMQAENTIGETFVADALNEVSMLRQSYQAAKLRITIDGKERLKELICDGVMVATPQGSTAYNLSAHGPILPLNSPLLALTPISPFRPRHWRGALLPDTAQVEIEVLEDFKRPVNAVADHYEIKSVKKVTIFENHTNEVRLLFDKGHSWDERILAEQFRY